MHYFKRVFSVSLSLIIVLSVCLLGFTPANASGTGAGLAEWALKAYNEGWSYVYGGSTPGAVDCSGLIYSYCGGDRVGSAQLASATASGSVSSGIPRVHGLGLFQPGHVGVYVGDGMAVDARGTEWGVCYQSVYTKSWTTWFKLSAVSYVNNGWERFNGNYYYYEDGQYVVDCTREIGGETYTFSSSGKSDKTPSNMNAVANKNSNSSSTKATKATTAPTTEAPTESKTLQIGSSGEKVTRLQNRLTELGFYDGVATGYFGEATETAYKAFQAAAGVTVDGIAGESDLDILYSSSAPKNEAVEETEPATEEPTEEPTEEETEPVDDGIYSIGEQCDEIVNIQDKLYDLKYFYADSTGYFGDLTYSAVVDFQNINGLEATGEVDEETYALLFSENALENPNYQEPTTEPTTEAVENTYSTPIDNYTPTQPVVTLSTKTIESAQEVVMKTNKVANKALTYIDDENNGLTVNLAKENNKNFLLWLFLVLGILAVAGGITYKLNKTKKYQYAHIKNKRRNENIRYW